MSAHRPSIPGAVDAHIHISGAYRSLDRLLSDLDAAGIAQAFVFAHPAPGTAGPPVPRWYARTIHRTWFGQLLVRLAPHTPWFPQVTRFNNDDVFALCKSARHRGLDRLFPLYFVNPYDPAESDNLRAAVEQHGAVGVKLHLWMLYISLLDCRLTPIFEYAAQRHLIVLIDLGAHRTAFRELAIVARQYPTANFIIPHLPPPLNLTLSIATNRANVYLDTSGPQVAPNHVQRAIRLVGAHKLLFGSDTLSATRDDIEYSVGVIESSTHNQYHRALVYRDNALRLVSQACHNTCIV